MSQRNRFGLLGLGLALLIGVVLWLGFGASDGGEDALRPALAPQSEPGERLSSAALSTTSRERRAAEGEPSLAEARPSEMSAPAASALATLRVRVVQGEKQEPAPGVLVKLRPRGSDELFDLRAREADAQGQALYENLSAGRYVVMVWRGEDQAYQAFELAPGENAERTLALEGKVRIRGVVVDEHEQPLPGAEVLVASWGGGEAQRLAITDARGRFDLPWMHTHVHVGARAAGYAASPLTTCTASEHATVELVIRLTERAAELRGIVFDPEGRPVDGSLVQAGTTEQAHRELPDGTSAMGPREARTRTDAEGRFHFPHLAVGPCPLEVRLRELSSHRETLELRAGGENFVTVHLQRGAELFGTVRDESGSPLPKVELAIGAWDSIARQRVESQEDGGYRFRGLGSGEHDLRVRGEAHGTLSLKVELRAGAETRCDPTFPLAFSFRGRVFDENGAPRSQVMVEVQSERSDEPEPWYRFENTGEDGRFALEGCRRDQTLRLSFRRQSVFPELVLRNVVPSESELEVRLPPPHWIRIRGRVVAPDGSVPTNVQLSPWKSDGNGSPVETADPKTGAFDLGPYPVGEYGLRIQAAGFSPLAIDPRKLEPNEIWDIGDLTLAK
ncbi:MAG: carboxypeptidase regulatory-like domain-containing protein [Planctomycetes bacterium]|nr:carboxypeptidase regulatory-like domain-containing protein [Planctomycetota bacterium]